MYLGYFSNFQKSTQSKQSPNWRKFVQSGHPATSLPRLKSPTYQGCQIFWYKHTKLGKYVYQMTTNYLYQTAINYTKWS
jgi:hypothetical protein